MAAEAGHYGMSLCGGGAGDGVCRSHLIQGGDETEPVLLWLGSVGQMTSHHSLDWKQAQSVAKKLWVAVRDARIYVAQLRKVAFCVRVRAAAQRPLDV